MQNNLPKIFLFVDDFNLKEFINLNKNIDIIYRNYKKKIDKSILLSIKRFCKKTNRKFYISNDIKLALNLDIDGLYIPSFNKKINYVNHHIQKKFHIIGSAHNKIELRIKKLQKCNMIFLSPIFKTNKNDKFLGVIKFNLITLNEKKMFIALGGINKKNINKIHLTKSVGIAGISWIKKNGPRYYLRPFNKSLIT
tara:strand:+ start:7407 stop:7991 length:585 start_codon:yes stop_codon:yes gene_type:complete